MTELDHIVLAVPDLAEGVAWFQAVTGVALALGGSHPGLGTANHLGDLGNGAYLELIGPDPAQAAVPSWLGVAEVDGPTITTWAVRVDDPGAVEGWQEMSRRTPENDVLRWRLTAADLSDGGVHPFMIDWGTTPHPTTRDLPAVELVEWVPGERATFAGPGGSVTVPAQSRR